ncbi:GTP cyclohydrolase II [Apiotrichum porosum]|uniref:GTP cyclohydrolase II n=1 Tax=Apiotrichum porosum TaxID=105984 RepID=A0A427Y0Y3_9TREE|nr:GTP cyclohydrolase II [Apiotrichum porosum]RSH84824.1 GTP cyclohydrolase II [Apiotrichum porosum]
MPAVLPAHHSSASTLVSQADLDILSLLTADVPPISVPTGTAANGARKKANLPRRDTAIDSLLLSAVLAGAGSHTLTRHHFGHGMAPSLTPGAYATCDQSRPSSPARRTQAPPPVKSQQAPRSVRLQAEQAQGANGAPATSPLAESSKTASQAAAATSSSASVSPTTALATSRERLAESSAPTTVSSVSVAKERKRRMSIDPAPISQVLQVASPAHVNYYHGRGLVLNKTAERPQVRCMARTRVPTPHGDIFLHLYHNSTDNKEHLAIVTDPIQLSAEARRNAPKGRREIRSRSLDAVWREGETDMERIVRGAYVGRLHAGEDGQPSAPHTAATYAPDPDAEADILPMVRIHSECFTGETIGSMRCDCGEQLDEAMRRIAEPQRVPTTTTTSTGSSGSQDAQLPTPEASRAPSPGARPSGPLVPGRGVVIYMRQEGRGIGLLEKIRAYNLQDLGHDTVTANLLLGHGADERTYAVSAEILADLGLAGAQAVETSGIRLLTNNPEKVEGLQGEGVRITERVGMVPRDWQCRHSDSPRGAALELDDDEKEYDEWRARQAGVGLLGAATTRGPELEKYLRTKIERMGHMIDIPESE